MTTKKRGAVDNRSRTWPKKALALFVLILASVYALVFFTGSRSLEPKLGIDLQGGTRVTLVPQGDKPTADQLKQAREILERRVNGMGVSGAEVVTNGDTLVITVPGEDTSQAQAVGQTSKLLFRTVNEAPVPDTAKLAGVIKEMANRWVEYGVISKDDATAQLDQVSKALTQGGAAAPDLQIDATPRPAPKNSLEEAERRQKVTEILLKDRQSTDPTDLVAASTLLKCQGDTDPLAGADDPAKPLAACDYANNHVYILQPTPLLNGISDPDGKRLTGNEIDTGQPITGGLNPHTGQMEISFAFKTGDGPSGSQTWADLTAANLKKQIAITLDSAVISAPVIQGATPYGSSTSITGDFSQAQASSLANNLKYGALPLSFVGANGERGGTTEIVPPSLGQAALRAGLIAGLVGFILITLYSLYYFRGMALISMVTLAGALTLTLGTLVLLGRWIGYSLDLSGIAGLIIGIGATVDSFVVYYERIKDELLEGRTFRSATTRAWARARSTIVTGNAVTLLGSAIVYLLAIGEVKGFAFTLGLTTFYDLVVSFLITAPLMQIIAPKPAWAQPALNGFAGVFNLVAERRENSLATQSAPASDPVSAPASDPASAPETEEN